MQVEQNLHLCPAGNEKARRKGSRLMFQSLPDRLEGWSGLPGPNLPAAILWILSSLDPVAPSACPTVYPVEFAKLARVDKDESSNHANYSFQRRSNVG
jgi:hypothetical protein